MTKGVGDLTEPYKNAANSGLAVHNDEVLFVLQYY